MPAHSPIDDRLDFAIIDDDVKRTLVEIRPLMVKHLPAVMNRFYDHLKKYPEMVAMFRSEERMDYAKEKQTNHWAEILNGDFGSQYVKSVHKIGRVHNRIGLEPKWYIGGYSFIATGLIQAV